MIGPIKAVETDSTRPQAKRSECVFRHRFREKPDGGLLEGRVSKAALSMAGVL